MYPHMHIQHQHPHQYVRNRRSSNRRHSSRIIRCSRANIEYLPLMTSPILTHGLDRDMHTTVTQHEGLNPEVRWDYDVFLREVEDNAIFRVDMRQDQKEAEVKFKNGISKHIALPSGYNHIGLLMEHDVEIHIDQLPLFSPVDISLFAVQLVLFVRLLFRDQGSNTKAPKKARTDKKKSEQRLVEATRESGEIIAEIFTKDIDVTTMTHKEKLDNDVLVNMSGLITEDLFNGMLRNVSEANFDMFHAVKLAFHCIMTSDASDTLTFSESIKCLYSSYRRARILLKRNLKYIKRLRDAILSQDEPLDDNQIKDIVSGINCEFRSESRK